MTAIGPGSLVKCVNAGISRWNPQWGPPNLVVGRIYTVAEIVAEPIDGSPCIRLVEVAVHPEAIGFDPDRFIPVDDSRLDIFRDVPADLDEVPA